MPGNGDNSNFCFLHCSVFGDSAAMEAAWMQRKGLENLVLLDMIEDEKSFTKPVV